jgi:hypothetical protein
LERITFLFKWIVPIFFAPQILKKDPCERLNFSYSFFPGPFAACSLSAACSAAVFVDWADAYLALAD